jgi:hypothetical protein
MRNHLDHKKNGDPFRRHTSYDMYFTFRPRDLPGGDGSRLGLHPAGTEIEHLAAVYLPHGDVVVP